MQKREYDTYLYTIQPLAANAFLKLKRLRDIDTHYAKYLTSFRATVQFRCVTLFC